ncbi:Glycerol kinase like protein [Verticillium longisporum]|uniref:glycerol kinase n=1 Tax=Verticillium longisporum TaxID=100787 RepID=A0A8I3ALK2_VERLO|nr:Glycerol kinase like protein [Verticillium longisporum]
MSKNIEFVGAIDQGTTSSRFLIFNPKGEVVATHQLEFKQLYPQPGWHEHDPEELISSVETCIDGAVKAFETQGHSKSQIKAVGITNQRETTVVWDKNTGKALYNAIVWTDTRAQELVRRLKHRLGAGDQSAALVGQKGFFPGLAKNTYGTGCFLLYNVGDKPVISSHGLMTTIAFDFGDKGGCAYALEGSIAVAGSSVKFLVDNLGFIEESSKLSALAETVEDNGGCTFVTAFSGLFAPYWIDDARGTIFGITAYTKRGHIARATLEATCFQTKAILDSMEKDSGAALTELAVDGGMCNSDLIMQTQSDLIGMPVNRPAMRETTAFGAAIAAGLAVGVWDSFDDLKNTNTEGRTIFKPQINDDESAKRFKKWEKAVQMSAGWANE